MKPHVVVYKKLPEHLLQRLQAECNVTLFDRITQDNRADFLAALKTAHGMIGASLPITNDMLEGAPSELLHLLLGDRFGRCERDEEVVFLVTTLAHLLHTLLHVLCHPVLHPQRS